MEAPEARGRPDSERGAGPDPAEAFWVEIFRSLSSSERMSTLERTLTCLTAGSAGAGAERGRFAEADLGRRLVRRRGAVAGVGFGPGLRLGRRRDRGRCEGRRLGVGPRDGRLARGDGWRRGLLGRLLARQLGEPREAIEGRGRRGGGADLGSPVGREDPGSGARRLRGGGGKARRGGRRSGEDRRPADVSRSSGNEGPGASAWRSPSASRRRRSRSRRRPRRTRTRRRDSARRRAPRPRGCWRGRACCTGGRAGLPRRGRRSRRGSRAGSGSSPCSAPASDAGSRPRRRCRRPP